MMTAPLMMRVAIAVAGMVAVGVDRHLGGDFFKKSLHVISSDRKSLSHAVDCM